MALLAAEPAQANDKIVFAVAGLEAWDSSVVEFGKRKGFFAEAGIDVEVAGTENAAAALQALIAGSADIASAAVAPFMAARMQGAPLKMFSGVFKGSSDWLWYVKTDSAIQTFNDLKADTTIGVNSTGGTAYVLVRSMLDQYGKSSEIVAAGGSAALMTQVMTGQLDVGTDGNGLLGVPEYDNGDVRPVAFGRELELLRDVTVRGVVASEITLTERRDVLVRFVQAYKKTADWMYSDPEAVQWFAEQTGATLAEAERVKRDMYPEGVIAVGEVAGVDASVKMALDFGRIERAPTDEELASMFDIVWQPGAM
jgi:NitT/TauT family transport system substrate-binding protein